MGQDRKFARIVGIHKILTGNLESDDKQGETLRLRVGVGEVNGADGVGELGWVCDGLRWGVQEEAGLRE